jgi:hypothetical protein
MKFSVTDEPWDIKKVYTFEWSRVDEFSRVPFTEEMQKTFDQLIDSDKISDKLFALANLARAREEAASDFK